MEFLFTCLSLGNNAGECQTETLPYTTPDEFGPIVACKVACLYSCSPLEAGPPDDAP
jgi:hypothetical protein